MKYQFEILKQTRINILSKLENLSIDEINTIPKGFNNNIAWNFCHIVLVLELLCYKLSGLPLRIDKELVHKYTKGSVANTNISKEEIEYFKSLALSGVENIEKDYNKGLFKKYTEYPTSYNVTLRNIEEAISFNNLHEGLHFGYILAQIKALGL